MDVYRYLVGRPEDKRAPVKVKQMLFGAYG
jgi:hypothetical protein